MKPRKLLYIPMAFGVLLGMYLIATGPNPCDGTARACNPEDTSSFLDVLELFGAVLISVAAGVVYMLLWALEERKRQQQQPQVH